MVGIFVDDRVYVLVVEEIIFVFVQMQGDFGVVIGFGDISYGIFVFVGGFLEYVVFWFVVCCMGMYGYFVCYDEG